MLNTKDLELFEVNKTSTNLKFFEETSTTGCAHSDLRGASTAIISAKKRKFLAFSLIYNFVLLATKNISFVLADQNMQVGPYALYIWLGTCFLILVVCAGLIS